MLLSKEAQDYAAGLWVSSQRLCADFAVTEAS
jgi:hypothetical protein